MTGTDNKGGGNIPITTDGTWAEKYEFISNYAFAVGNPKPDDKFAVYINGTGLLNKEGDPHYGKYLHAAIVDRPTFPYTIFEFLDEKPKPCGDTLEPLTPSAQEVTIAVNDKLMASGVYTCGQKFTIDLYPGKIFKIGDAGTFTDENKNPDRNHFDIYVGEIHKKEFDTSYPQPLSGYIQQVQ